MARFERWILLRLRGSRYGQANEPLEPNFSISSTRAAHKPHSVVFCSLCTCLALTWDSKN